jgi:regulator of replication initiation timing
METIFQDPVDDFGNTTNIFDDLVKEVKTLCHENDALKTKNEKLKNQIKYCRRHVPYYCG